MKRTEAILQIVAIEVCDSNHGDFLKHVAHAWLTADRQSKQILKPAWLILVNNYDLEKEYAEVVAEHIDEYLRRKIE